MEFVDGFLKHTITVKIDCIEVKICHKLFLSIFGGVTSVL